MKRKKEMMEAMEAALRRAASEEEAQELVEETLHQPEDCFGPLVSITSFFSGLQQAVAQFPEEGLLVEATVHRRL